MRCTHRRLIWRSAGASAAPALPGVVGERLGPLAPPRLRLRTAALFDASAPRGSSSSTSSCGEALYSVTDEGSYDRVGWTMLRDYPGTSVGEGEGKVTWHGDTTAMHCEWTNLVSSQLADFAMPDGAKLVESNSNCKR